MGNFIAGLIGWTYLAGIVTCFVAAVWSGDLRFLATGIIMIGCLVLVGMIPNQQKKDET